MTRWAVVVALLLLALRGANAAEVIHRFDSVVAVAADGTLTVTEILRVRAEGSEIRHGIRRDFPLTFRDASGALREVTFKLLDVTLDGKPEPHFTRRERGILHIYAGDKDALVPRGDHTYVFRYRTGRQIRWFDGKPELNWNVTGNFWNFPIQVASYRLHLPDQGRPLRWAAFTGPTGARGSDWQGAVGDDGVLTVATTRPLAPGEGLTVIAALPAASVAPPGAALQAWYTLLDNRHWIFSGVGFALVLGFYLAIWSAVGRDPRPGTIIPLFHPPKGVSPALANYIHNWGFGRDRWRAFTAAALSLAVRGLIAVDQRDDALTLTVKEGNAAGRAALPSGEKAILAWLAANGGSVSIDRAHGAAVQTGGDEFTSSIEKESRHRFFRHNFGYVVAGLAMTFGVVVGVIRFGGLGEEDIQILAFMGFGGLWLGLILMPILGTLFRGRAFDRLFRAAMSLVFLAVVVTIVVKLVRDLVPDALSAAAPLIRDFIAGYPFPFVLVTAFAAINGLFFYLMRAPTALGRPVMDQLAGLKLYLETAEADRLNLQAPEITAERFETLLPYAVALDVEKPWSDAFAAALRRAYPDDDDVVRHYRPTWSSGGSNWSGRNFGSAVASTVGSVSSALASAAPVSSGSSGFSSGGGGSGGGGGGGGGGGW